MVRTLCARFGAKVVQVGGAGALVRGAYYDAVPGAVLGGPLETLCYRQIVDEKCFHGKTQQIANGSFYHHCILSVEYETAEDGARSEVRTFEGPEDG